jgi:hypothetical protein
VSSGLWSNLKLHISVLLRVAALNQVQGGTLAGIPAHGSGEVRLAGRVDPRLEPGAGNAHVELLPVHQLPAVLGIDHHQRAVHGPPLAGVAGQGVGQVHRLDPSEIQLDGSAATFQLDFGLAGVPVQLPDEPGIAVGDAEALTLDSQAVRFLGFPILDPVADGEPPGFDPGHLDSPEPMGLELHMAAIRQTQP